jgi:pyruvate,water dikinase
MWHFRKTREPDASGADLERLRARYFTFRELLALNNECLELMAEIQDDLQYVPPSHQVLGGRIARIYNRIRGVVALLERLTHVPQPVLPAAVVHQQQEIERYLVTMKQSVTPNLFARLSRLTLASEREAGRKAAVLGEIRDRLGLPVPDGFVLTTEAYRQFCGVPLWQEVRDATRGLDLNDLEGIQRVSESLKRRVMEIPMPDEIEVAIAGLTEELLQDGGTLAVRSSALGEGGARSFAGQFLTLLNVPAAQAADAYRRVIASRFSERALFYRLSTGLRDVDSPMAALFVAMLPARAAGIMYTRDPGDAKSRNLWITATRGLGLGIASGSTPADLFVLSRGTPHAMVERNIVHKEEEFVLRPEGGISKARLSAAEQDKASLSDSYLQTLADWGVRIETHFRSPQDIEWVLDPEGALWIVQSRPLVNSDASRAKARSRTKGEAKLAGGRTVFPGRTSGKAFLVDEIQNIVQTPSGSVVFIRKPSPEIVQVFPRIAGLVAEWGNVAGHAAALLREFRIPSVFQMTGAFEHLSDGDLVSLDAVLGRVYSGILWPSARRESSVFERYREHGDPISARLLTLNLVDPSDQAFRPAGCKSGHDVLRYCHEKAIETMLAVHDRQLKYNGHSVRKLETTLPLNLSVIDLGGGVALADPQVRRVTPEQIVSRPFQALWNGISHPEVSWTRHMPARLGDLASILASTLTPEGVSMRPLGEDSYLLVADEYLNLNARLAYHYSLVDACLSDTPGDNYISFRFEGGGATQDRRSLRACFLERCLVHYGFRVDRRRDLVNAWFRKGPPDQTAGRLDLLGRLMACSSQLDMYMNSLEVMNWFAEQFILGNYAFRERNMA